MALPQEETRVTTPEEFLQTSEFTLVVDHRLTVLMKYPDIIGAMAEGALTMELMTAADEFMNNRPDIDSNLSGADAIKRLEAAITPEFKEFLRRYAIAFVESPSIQWAKDIVVRGSAIPVERLTTQQLITIWNAEPPSIRPAPKVADPKEFRSEESTVPGSPLPAREEVRTPSIFVDSGSEFKYQ